jgi:hypothetical protein
MSDKGPLGRFNLSNVVNQVKELTNRSKGPLTPRANEAKEERRRAHDPSLDFRGLVTATKKAGGNETPPTQQSDSDTSRSHAIQGYAKGKFAEEAGEAEGAQSGDVSGSEIEGGIRGEAPPTTITTTTTATTQPGPPQAPPVRPVLVERHVEEVKEHRFIPAGNHRQQAEKSAGPAPESEKLKKRPEIPRLKMPTTEEAEASVGLPVVDKVPEIKTARPNVGSTPRKLMVGRHARNISDQLGPKKEENSEKPRKMFAHRRLVTDSPAPLDKDVKATKIGNRTPRETPSRKAKPLPELPLKAEVKTPRKPSPKPPESRAKPPSE